MSDFRPRPAQAPIINYRKGRMGVAAVPGSGKTWTLSRLASEIIKDGYIGPDQEILIVTLVNSAVDNFRVRIGGFIKEAGLLPQIGYRVRTLHGLAKDIIFERPDLVGLSEDIYLLDERDTNQIMTDVTNAWLRAHPGALDEFMPEGFDDDRRAWIRRDKLPRLVQSIAKAFIKLAKDRELHPEMLANRIEQIPASLPLAEMGTEIYQAYRRALVYRGALDFDDLIQLAVEALEIDRQFKERLQERWPFILEDEAQDSSQLQEKILRLLSGKQGNWVRVGDPNQAIFESFTTASPEFLRRFLEEPDVQSQALPNSGRSTESIIHLANYLIDWTMNEHPVAELRSALSPPFIEPTPQGDPQPNPPDQPDMIHLFGKRMTPEEEMLAVADSLANWLPDNQDKTVAVLVPRNTQGFAFSEILRKRGIEYTEMLQSAKETRLTAGALGNILNFLSDPKSPKKLAIAYQVWRREDREDEDAKKRLEYITSLLRTCKEPESYLWPTTEDWLYTLGIEGDPETLEQLEAFREYARRWQEATFLPIDQLILTLAQDLFVEPSELALAHKLALVLKRAGNQNTEWRLPELAIELKVVAKNERRFIGFSADDTGFDPEAHRGKVVITTVHKAKGLEWDRVYLMSVNNYDYPSAQEYDRSMAENFFIKDRLYLQDEALRQMDFLIHSNEFEWYEEGEATQEAKLMYASERLRLFFVGITRAKEQLIVTWNTGPRGENQQAIPFIALESHWNQTDETD